MLLMLKPVLPYISDSINHIFFYAKHMATVHYENGKYHVHYETAKHAREEGPAKTPGNNSKKDTATNEYVLILSSEGNDTIDFNGILFAAATTPSLLSSPLQNNYPPPRL